MDFTVTIRAVRWTGDNRAEVVALLATTDERLGPLDSVAGWTLDPGDWVVVLPLAEHAVSVCTDVEFRATARPVAS